MIVGRWRRAFDGCYSLVRLILKSDATRIISGALGLKTIFTITTLKGWAFLSTATGKLCLSTEIAFYIWTPVFYQLSTQLRHIFIPVSNTARKEFETDGPMVKNSF